MLGLGLGVNKLRNLYNARGFTPRMLKSLVAWYESRYGVNAKTAADFVAANNEYLSTTDSFFTVDGTFDFSFGGWFLNDTTNINILMGCWSNTSDKSIAIQYNSGFKAFGTTNGTTLTSTASVGAGSGSWVYLVCVYDSTADLLKLSLNSGAFATVSLASINASADPFCISSDFTTFDFDGAADGCFFVKEALSLAQITSLYNSGNGVDGATGTALFSTSDWAWWELNELSGNRADYGGNYTLTDNNTVGSTLGKIVEPIENGEAVFQWLDKSGNGYHASQDTFANQPTYSATVPDVQFNGTTDTMPIDSLLTPLAATTQGTWAAWVRPTTGVPGAVNAIVCFGDTNAESALMLYQNSNGKLYFYAENAGVNVCVLNTDDVLFVDGVWAHVAVSHNGTIPTLYFNAVAVDQTISGGVQSTWFNDVAGLDNGRIGVRNFNSLGDTNHFDGDIQQVEIFNQALSATEILKLSQYNPPS